MYHQVASIADHFFFAPLHRPFHVCSYEATNQYTQAAQPTGTGAPVGQEVSEYYLLVSAHLPSQRCLLISRIITRPPYATRILLNTRTHLYNLLLISIPDRLHKTLPRRAHPQLPELEILILCMVRLHRAVRDLVDTASTSYSLRGSRSVMEEYSDEKDKLRQAQP